jgi:hypothetical protein
VRNLKLIDKLVEVYNKAAADKILFREHLIFIAERLKLIMFELDGVEQDVESFKKVNKLTDIDAGRVFYRRFQRI